MANVNGLIGALVRDLDDMIGAKFTRKRTLVKFLDAANFPGGVNPTADPSAALPDDVFIVDRKSAENKVFVEWELAASFDVAGMQLPRRYIVQNVCNLALPWRRVRLHRRELFRRERRAGGQLGAGRVRQASVIVSGAVRRNNPLPYGGFPAAGLTR